MAGILTPSSIGEPSPPPSHRAQPKPASKVHNRPHAIPDGDDPRVIFNKTIDGHYRHGGSGYRKVGALFLTWKDDDMHCKESEVDKLRSLFEHELRFNTDCYEIPSERWETALHKRLADFCHEYNHPEDLAIIYYGGHAYTGRETKEFKLSAKYENDGHGDPTAFFNDVRTCLRLPTCDQLVILDCCYAARAFQREHVGKRKFELLAATAHDTTSPAPKSPHSFTKALNDAMSHLLSFHPEGFSTSQLYREIYHLIPTEKSFAKPWLFDQARQNLGRIWLRPQMQIRPKPIRNGQCLKLTLKLNADLKPAVMNELAQQLQYLPHVDQIRLEDLYAPRKQLEDFTRFVWRTTLLKPLIKKKLAEERLRKVAKLAAQEYPNSFAKLHMDGSHRKVCDWADAIENDHKKQKERPNPSDFSASIHSPISVRYDDSVNGQAPVSCTAGSNKSGEATSVMEQLQESSHNHGTSNSGAAEVENDGYTASHRKRQRSQSLDSGTSLPKKSRKPSIE